MGCVGLLGYLSYYVHVLDVSRLRLNWVAGQLGRVRFDPPTRFTTPNFERTCMKSRVVGPSLSPDGQVANMLMFTSIIMFSRNSSIGIGSSPFQKKLRRSS
jgi:hypothetical protein